MPFTLGSRYGGDWTSTGNLLTQLQRVGVTESEISSGFDTYLNRTGANGLDIAWWGDAAGTSAYLTGLQWAYPQKYPDAVNRWSAAAGWTAERQAAEQNRTAQIGMADQAKNGKKGGLGDLAILAAIGGVVTGGLSLIGSLGSAAVGAAGAGLAEVAGLAALDAGFVGAAGASSISAAGIGGGAAGIGGTLGTIANIARPAYSVASGINTLTGGSSSRTPTPSTILNRNTNTMANPFYVIATEPDNGKQQSAAPASVGKTPPPAALGMGVSGNTLALLAVAAVAWYAFSQDK